MARPPRLLALALVLASAGARRGFTRNASEPLCPPCFRLENAAHGNRTLPALRWLHLPKSGSTFQNTVFHYACPGLPPRAGYGPRATPFKLKALYGKARTLDRERCDRDVDMTLPGHPPAVAAALGRTVAMFRSPKQRIISAYRNGRHCDGFQDEDKDANWKRLTVAEYATHRGIPGCVTRMLSGGKCARARHVRTAYSADAAVAAVARLAFVGILERWRDSICLFHAMHGGAPRDIEFGLAHSTRTDGSGALHGRPAPYDEAPLGGAVDADDEAVYAAALEAFDAEMRAHAPACPRR